MTKGYRHSNQMALFGHQEIVGFGSDNFYVEEVDRDIAIDIIRANHYSGKVYPGSHIHLGVFINGEIMGALQFGPAMNPASGGSVVEGTAKDQYLELNRMWISDLAGRNSESRSISYAIKYIKRNYPKVKWIQSFADERCGGWGIVYQACSFGYYGEHTAIFWELDGEVYHNIEMSVTPNSDRYNKTSEYVQSNRGRAKRMTLRQFRYLKFIDRSWRERCLLPELPYPKHYEASNSA